MIVASKPTLARQGDLRSELRASSGDGAAFGAMVGMGETYVPAFALALGMGEVTAGLVATLPLLIGSLLQLSSPWAIGKVGSYRRWVVGCATIQAISLLMLVGIALLATGQAWVVFVCVSLYWASGLSAGPAWNAWAEHFIPIRLRAMFLAGRTRLSQACVLTGLVVGGLLLRSWSPGSLTPFAVIFTVAAVCRFCSAGLLWRQQEPASIAPLASSPFAGMRKDFPLMAFFIAMQMSVFIAGPYFTPFMLKQISLGYLEYTALLSFGFLGKVLALPRAARMAKRMGTRPLLWIGGIGVVPLSAMWLVSNSFWFLVGLQICGGILWAFYELAMVLIFFEKIPHQRRVAFMTVYNLSNSAAMVGGALIGAAVLRWIEGGREAYLAVFLLSSICRLLTLVLIPRHPGPAIEPEALLATRTIAVRPTSGTMERPIVPALQRAAVSEEGV